MRHGSGSKAKLFYGADTKFSAPAVYLFEYNSQDREITVLGDLLGQAVEQACRDSRVASVVLVTFSMGALVARSYLEGLSPDTPYRGDVARLYMIAPPNNGSLLAKAPFRPEVCAALPDVAGSTDFLERLNNQPDALLPKELKLAIVAGVGCLLPVLGWWDGIVLESTTYLSGTTVGRGLCAKVARVFAKHSSEVLWCGGHAFLDNDVTSQLVAQRYREDFAEETRCVPSPGGRMVVPVPGTAEDLVLTFLTFFAKGDYKGSYPLLSEGDRKVVTPERWREAFAAAAATTGRLLEFSILREATKKLAEDLAKTETTLPELAGAVGSFASVIVSLTFENIPRMEHIILAREEDSGWRVYYGSDQIVNRVNRWYGVRFW